MKNKLKMILLGVLCAVCLQAPVAAHAVDLPFVPVDDSETDTVTTTVTGGATPVVTENQTTVTTSKPTTTSTQKPVTTTAEGTTTTTQKSEASSDNASTDDAPAVNSDNENNEMPVLSPDGETIVTTTLNENEPSEIEKSTKAKDSSISEDSDFSDDKDNSEANEKSSLPIIISVICGTTAIAGAVIFGILKRGKK